MANYEKRILKMDSAPSLNDHFANFLKGKFTKLLSINWNVTSQSRTDSS